MKVKFNFRTLLFFVALSLIATACKDKQKTLDHDKIEETEKETPFFKLSLAQWSIHKMIIDEGLNPFDFAKKAKQWGFEGLEYVSFLYAKELEKYGTSNEGMEVIISRLKQESDAAQIKNLLIMVDGEGDLAATDEASRNEAVQNHKKWVDAAQSLGCHSIRVNLFGTNDPKIWVEAATDGLSKLSDYAVTKNINILVENHGWLSSDIPVLMSVINKVKKANCGTLPDFGNFCVKRPEGERWGECLEEYPDKYKGVELMMPKAKAVSAKSYDFDEHGNETTIDYARMLQIVKDAGYTGFIGIEYEGNRLTEEQGIKATKKLLLNVAEQLN